MKMTIEKGNGGRTLRRSATRRICYDRMRVEWALP
jgi:hypothetical protein